MIAASICMILPFLLRIGCCAIVPSVIKALPSSIPKIRVNFKCVLPRRALIYKTLNITLAFL